jgi:hypothetical protein
MLASPYHGAVPHADVHGRRSFGHADDGRPAGAPDGDGDGVADVQRQLLDDRRGQPHRVVLLQADEPQLQRQRPEAVGSAAAVLLYQPQLDEADQIGMRLGGRHAGFPRQVFQRHRPAMVGQGQQQLAADLDALNATRGFGFVHAENSILLN